MLGRSLISRLEVPIKIAVLGHHDGQGMRLPLNNRFIREYRVDREMGLHEIRENLSLTERSVACRRRTAVNRSTLLFGEIERGPLIRSSGLPAKRSSRRRKRGLHVGRFPVELEDTDHRLRKLG